MVCIESGSLRLCRNAADLWELREVLEMITHLEACPAPCYISILITSPWNYIIPLNNQSKEKQNKCLFLFQFSTFKDLYSFSLPLYLPPSLPLSFTFPKLIKDNFFFHPWWEELGEKRQMVSFAKGKLRNHTYISALWQIWCQDSSLKCVVWCRHRGVPERVRPGMEGSAINCCRLIQQQNMGAITLWQLFYFSLMEFQTCPVHWDSFHLVKTCAVFKLPLDPWNWRWKKNKKF